MTWLVKPSNTGNNENEGLDCAWILFAGVFIGACWADDRLCNRLCIMHVEDYDCL